MIRFLLSIGRRAVSYARHLLVRASFQLFERLTSVRDDFWCFCTWEDYAHTIDNPRAVFEAVKNEASLRKIVLQKRPDPPPVREGASVEFVAAESIRGAYLLARSRVVLLGYALRGMSSYSWGLRDRRHEIVQLWHGIALKRIGRLVPGEEIWQEETPRYDATLASSEEDREVMAKAFAPIPRDRVWLTGLPRNDLILDETEALPGDYRRHLEDLEERLDGRRLVLYAPTWRQREETLYDFRPDERSELEDILARHGAVLGIRGHVKVRGHEAYADRPRSSAFLTLNDFPDVNVLLRRTDVLITDYSSLYIDFLLLDRPIVHFVYDLDAYRRERGFVHDPERAFGGPSATNFEALVNHLDASLRDRSHFQAQRRSARELYHAHPAESGAAVCGKIRELIGGGGEALERRGRGAGIGG